MKQIFSLLIILLAPPALFGQVSYAGFIDKYPIELVTNIYSDGAVRCIYAYSNFDDPIVVNGKLKKNRLTLFEKDKSGKNKAALVFENFSNESEEIEGNWTDLNTGKKFKISLTKMFDIDEGESTEAIQKEILQPVSLGNKYFKLVVSKTADESSARVTGIKIMEKKTDRLIQQIELDCDISGIDNVDTGDYNFDGITDFSVFEASYAGANTSSLYFLFNKTTRQYFDSGFSGTSLEFDNKAKRIFERNQCCAGSIVTTAEYKVVNNKMVLVKQHCYKWDEGQEKLVERDIKECQ